MINSYIETHLNELFATPKKKNGGKKVFDIDYFKSKEFEMDLMGIMIIFRECNKIITALQSPSVFLHEAYSIILQHIRTLFDYSCEMVVKELKNGSRIMGWLFDCAIESANITNVLKFTRVYLINLMKRFVNISGTTSIPINQIARIETFDMFMEVFYKENKNNPCLKDLIQTNPDLFGKIMIDDIGSIVRIYQLKQLL